MMFNEFTDALKFDSRLRARRGWVSADELAQELSTLPDCADKVLAHGEEVAPKPSPASASHAKSAAPAVPATPKPSATFGAGFSDSVARTESSESLEGVASTDRSDDGGGFGGTHNA